MKQQMRVCIVIFATLVFACLSACSHDGAENSTANSASDATTCEYVKPDSALDVERLKEGVTTVSIYGLGINKEFEVGECDDLFTALAETQLALEVIPAPTPTPAPGYLLLFSLQNELDDSLYSITLKYEERLGLSVYTVGGHPDHNYWYFIIESEDGHRIHEIAKRLCENAD